MAEHEKSLQYEFTSFRTKPPPTTVKRPTVGWRSVNTGLSSFGWWQVTTGDTIFSRFLIFWVFFTKRASCSRLPLEQRNPAPPKSMTWWIELSHQNLLINQLSYQPMLTNQHIYQPMLIIIWMHQRMMMCLCIYQLMLIDMLTYQLTLIKLLGCQVSQVAAGHHC